MATKGLTVNALPAVAAITGSHAVAAARTTTLANTTTGGAWSSSNTAIATVNASGVVTGVAAGTTSINYAVSNSCGPTTVTYSITVSNLPPQAVNDTVSTLYNTPVSINAFANDIAGSGSLVASSLVLTGTLPSTSTVGAFVNNANGSVTFTPVSGYSGTFSVSYRVTDALSQTTTAIIVVTVNGPVIVDTDHDGAPDGLDEYPADPTRAFNNTYPAIGFSTLMYEDLWPYKGDYDFNDLVIDYKYNRVTNAQNNVVEVKYTFVSRCAGAGLHNGFAFQMDNVAPSKITSVTGTKTHGATWVSNASNGTESGQTYTNVIVFDNIYNILNYPGSGHFLNTDITAPKINYDTTSITVVLINNGVAPSGGTLPLSGLPATAFNPYLILGVTGTFNQDRTKELHLSDRMPSSKMSTQWFGTGDDNSIPSQGRYFRTKNNLPWAIEISNSIPYMQEYIDISEGYVNFLNWASSNGTTHADWYLDLGGYRNAGKLYNK